MGVKTRLVALAVTAGLTLGGTVALETGTASATAPTRAPQYQTIGKASPAVNGLRIRSGPGTQYGVYGLLYKSDRVTVTLLALRASEGYWNKVRLTRRSASGLRAGFTGWVYAPYLKQR